MFRRVNGAGCDASRYRFRGSKTLAIRVRLGRLRVGGCNWRLLSAIAVAPRQAGAETMQSALARAYQGNPQLNAQRAIVRQSDEGVAQALSGYRPTLSATATVGRQFTNEFGVIPPIPPNLPNGVSYNVKGDTTPWSAGFTGQQTLFNGEQTVNKVRKAESQVSASRETLRLMEESVLLAASTIYMDVSRDMANLEVQQNNVRVLAAHAEGYTEQICRGPSDAYRRRAGRSAIGGRRSNPARSRIHADHNSCQLSAHHRRRPGNLAPASPVDRLAPTTLDAAIAVGTAENPAITAAIYGVDVAQLQVKIAEGALLPTLALQGSVQQQNYPNILTPSLFLGTAVLNLTVPIYQGGANIPRSASTRRRRAAALERRSGARPDARQCRSGLGTFDRGEGTSRSRAPANDASERALNGVRNEAQAGQRTTLDVLNAEQASGECARQPDRGAARSRRGFL